MDDIPEDYDLRHDEALERADEERERGHAAERGGCPGVDPFEHDSDEELDVEADDDDEEPEGGPAEPLADDDDAEEEDPSEEEEDPSEDEEDDDRHAEEAPAETEPVDVPDEPVPAEVPQEIAPGDVSLEIVPIEALVGLVPADVPLEIVPVEAPAEPAPTEAPAGGEVTWIDIEMDPRSVVPEAPPISPIALGSPAALRTPLLQYISDDDWEWETPPVTPPEPFTYEEDSEPDVPSPPPLPTSPPPPSPPPPPPVPMITVLEHDIIVAQHTAEMAAAHARIESLRTQLDAEVQERLQAQRRQRWSDFRVQRALGSVRRIERRALDRLHSVRRHRSRRHFRRAAARVISRSMRRVRRVIRGG